MAVFIIAKKEGYTINQCERTMTVDELIEELQCYNGDDPVYISNDNGHTFGSITEDDVY